jgi:ferritin-like metal-binding protein YciE
MRVIQVMNRDTLVAWLDDAYAMETQLLPVLRRQASLAGDSPDAQARIEAHIGETVAHADRVRQALQRLGGAPSKLRTGLALVMGAGEKLPGGILSDETLKHAITGYATEQFEVAAYTALIAAAEQAGEAEVARLCRLNRGEDEEMAEWLDARISILIERRTQALGTAKSP